MLTRGNKGDGVKDLQRSLNRLGSMLMIDGDFGPSTEAAVVDARVALKLEPSSDADDILIQRLAQLPEPSPELTAPGVTFIGREEVSSPAEYRKKYLRPTWPGPTSGITIGIGYDLRFADLQKLQNDWGEMLPPETIARLVEVSGTVGSEEKRKRVEDVTIPLPAAIRTFLNRMMPEHVNNTRGAYPSMDTLPAHRRTALISLVFNRGGSLDRTSDRRREMVRIGELLAAGDMEGVPPQFESMTRIWTAPQEQGLIDRRRLEARLWKEGFAALQLE